MLVEKLGITVGAFTLATAWVGGLAWVHGDGGPSADVSAVGQPTRVAVTPGIHGYGNATSMPSPTAAPRATPAPDRAERSRPARRPARAPARALAPAPAPLVPMADELVPETGEHPPGTDPGTVTGPQPGPQSGPQPGPQSGSGAAAEFTLASFNVLGSSHTQKGGHSAGRASGPQRIGGVLQILGQHDISVVGFQEFQRNQRAAFVDRAPGWAMYPTLSMAARTGENTVAWRSDTWELVKPGLVPIPYFNGRERLMPYVLLRHKKSGVRSYFSTFHNPADTRRFRGQQRYRNAATEREINLFNRLEREGVPQFVTGDMNERAEYFCKVTTRTRLIAAAGGSSSGGCRPPRPTQIDWIFGSPGVVFSNYRVDRSPLVRRTTDHPVVVARASVAAGKLAHAAAPRG